MFDHETRIALAHDRQAQLQRDMRAAAYGRRRTRHALGGLLISLGDRLAEDCRRPRRELSFRA